MRFQRDGAGKFDDPGVPEWTGAVVKGRLEKDNAWQTIQMDFRRSDAVKKVAVERVTTVAGEAGLARGEHRAMNIERKRGGSGWGSVPCPVGLWNGPLW